MTFSCKLLICFQGQQLYEKISWYFIVVGLAQFLGDKVRLVSDVTHHDTFYCSKSSLYKSL